MALHLNLVNGTGSVESLFKGGGHVRVYETDVIFWRNRNTVRPLFRSAPCFIPAFLFNRTYKDPQNT